MPASLRLPLLLALLSLLTLACGSFAPRPQPTTDLLYRTPTPARPTPGPTPTTRPRLQATPPAARSTTTPTAVASPTPLSTGNLQPGRPARVVARTGLNIRSQPTIAASIAGRFAPFAVVRVLEGPVAADGYMWWQVDDGYGLTGWVAAGDGAEIWLDGDVGEPRPVTRPVPLGDVVTVSVTPGRVLTIRFEPGKKGIINRRVRAGTLLDVVQGPVIMDGLRWWRLRHDNGWEGWAAEGDGETQWLTPLE